ncbi:L-rhamnose mutarotase [Gelidibacter sp.]|uniref:L-rhamnose mutarotase n=1 Tax=Gelidibacter sp. TaxID=2018083 RepID=UPI002C066A0A|nr:L-rhamnose mutarotase [Gelidibacter sp.]HUH27943.1 L-rhamnose mutarotase [Gelidibacter sp.]
MKTYRHCFALDLINDPELILAYKKHHENVWPEIVKSIKDSGIVALEIYLVENRLFMIMEVNESFSFEKKDEMDANNPKVQEWERLMWQYQQALPTAKDGEKWLLMDQIYQLKA